MKSSVCCVCLLTLLLQSPVCSQNSPRGPLTVKGNVYYSVRGDRSSVSLLFKGKVEHAETRGGKMLTIECSGIATSPSHNASNLNFKDGLVRHVSVDRIDNGRTKVVLTLKNGSEAYDVVSDDAQGVVRVDIFRNPFAVKPATVAQAIVPNLFSPRRSPAPPEMHPDHETPSVPIVDLPAMVRGQLAEVIADKETQPAPTVSQPLQAPMGQDPATRSAMVWLGLACTSLLATLASLIILVRKALRRTHRPLNASHTQTNCRPQPVTTHPEQMTTEHDVKSRRFEDPDKSASRDMDDWDMVEESATTALSLAEQYRRSQGDVELAMKLRNNGTPASKDSKIGVIKAVKLPKKASAQVARKNGVGAGEIDLAAKLRKLQDAFTEKEEAV